MAIYKIKNVAATTYETTMCLNIHGKNFSTLSNNQNVTIWEESGAFEQKWEISSLASGVYVKSAFDTTFGLNAYRSGTNWNCDVYPISGNETDAEINFVRSGNYYKIQLANYPTYYLSTGGTTNGSNVYWTIGDEGNAQLWILEECPEPDYTYPTTIREMTQAYSSSHKAIDIGASTGTPVYAFTDGIISFIQNSSGSWNPDDPNPPFDDDSMESMGNCIAINHNNPDTSIKSGSYARTIYMHLRDNPTLAKGTAVTKGQLIGYVGNTGRSSGAHLHFALSVGNLTTMKPGYTANWVSLSTLPAIDPRVYLPEYVDNY